MPRPCEPSCAFCKVGREPAGAVAVQMIVIQIQDDAISLDQAALLATKRR
jgi:hypothetical protein